MNWRRGLFRAWAAASTSWVVGLLGLLVWSQSTYPDSQITVGGWVQFLSGTIGVPIVVLAIGRGFIWVVEGFRDAQR